MNEQTLCRYCTDPVTQLGIVWTHNPRPGYYRLACPSKWGHTAAPEESE